MSPPDPQFGAIEIRGARTHNLDDLSLRLPHGRWIAVTGPSGSGKSSLVFATLVAESQRRYLSTLSTRARHRLGSAARPDVDALEGLPVTIAIGQHDGRPNPRSTVGTLTGVLDLLRLWFAREAIDPAGTELSRSHFSFNRPEGACPSCGGIGLVDRVDPKLLIADPERSIRAGALRTTLKNGYTVYSQVTVDVMDQICRAHGFDVDTPWGTLSPEQHHVVLYGTDALEVPFGKHSLESRMKWKGITAKPRATGHYRGLVPVIEEILGRDRNPGVLRFVRSSPCNTCHGTRLDRPGREAMVDGATLPSLLAMPVTHLREKLHGLTRGPVGNALQPTIDERLVRLERLSLRHLSLDRNSTTLSGGETQRVRLAGQLATGLSGMLVCLDEPTLGLHPEAGSDMAAMLDEVVAGGNTLLVVEHDPDMVRYCDHVVAIGPGAGPEGGRLEFQGPPSADPLGPPPVPKPDAKRRPGNGQTICLAGATLHNLRHASLRVVGGALNVVIGPAGAGKSSLVFGTLLPALEGREGGSFTALEGVPSGTVRTVDARPPGRNARSTPATYTGLFDLVRDRFAAEPSAGAAGFGAGHFSHNNKLGRCPECEGLGTIRVGLHLMANAEVSCPRCRGRRYDDAVLAIHHRGLDVSRVLELSVDAALRHFAGDAPLEALLGAMSQLGLGYLRLGQPSASLSRGEAQRIKLASVLGQPGSPSLILLDEPDRGLHPHDIERLLAGLDALVDRGHTVVAISHHRAVWAAADYVTEIDDGRSSEVSFESFARLSTARPARPPAPAPSAVTLRGVSHHNLDDVDVDIPHDALTVVVGVSGSGKSSLVFDALVGEAWHRFAQALPFEARRHIRQRPRVSMREATGLRPTIALAQGQARAPRRSTVATQSELGPLLRTLWSRAGTLDGTPCQLSAEHFSPDRPLGACPTCGGRGDVARCSPERLITDAELPLAGGALRGTTPGKYFSDADGQHIATLRAALRARGFDDGLELPWSALPQAVRHLALHGLHDVQLDVTWEYERDGRRGEHQFSATWEGFCTLVEREAKKRAGNKNAANWQSALDDVTCPSCEGSRLAPIPARVEVDGHTLPAVLDLPLARVSALLEGLRIGDSRRAAALERLRPPIVEGVDELCRLGLGHLSLSRRSNTLSEGERQRVRLAGILRSRLSSTLVVLDEPDAGLHAKQLDALAQRLFALRERGNTVVVVTHRPSLIRLADHIIELGPGAGRSGGEVVASGTPPIFSRGDTATARALRSATERRTAKRVELRFGVHLKRARAHNLRSIDVDLPDAGLVAVSGVSGSGKSSLVFDVLGESAKARHPVACDEAGGLERFEAVHSARSGLTASTVLTALSLMKPLQRLFAEVAKPDGPPARAFSFASPAGRCPRCKGSGHQVVSMDVLADLELPCPACHGRRYRDEVLVHRWQGLDIAEFLDKPVAELPSSMPEALKHGAAALDAVGLGHLAFGRARESLSGGEAQRVLIASLLLSTRTSTTGKRSTRDSRRPQLVLLDEPAAGLHEQDVTRIVTALHRLADAGDLVVVTEHRERLIAAADWRIELGPGGGPDGGNLLAAGPP